MRVSSESSFLYFNPPPITYNYLKFNTQSFTMSLSPSIQILIEHYYVGSLSLYLWLTKYTMCKKQLCILWHLPHGIDVPQYLSEYCHFDDIFVWVLLKLFFLNIIPIEQPSHNPLLNKVQHEASWYRGYGQGVKGLSLIFGDIAVTNHYSTGIGTPQRCAICSNPPTSPHCSCLILPPHHHYCPECFCYHFIFFTSIRSIIIT